FGRTPDGDAEADQNGDGHHHLDHDPRLVAQAAEGAPVRSDPADDGVDVSLIGRKEHVSHRPCWVVPHPLRTCRGQASLSPTLPLSYVDLASSVGGFRTNSLPPSRAGSSRGAGAVGKESYRHSVY